MECCAIAAMSENHVIGRNNQLPWHLAADLQRVKALTSGQAILMGRKTYESIGKPLPNRDNILLSRNPNFAPAGCLVASDFASAVALCRRDRLFLFGGQTLFENHLSQVSRLYLTLVHTNIEGDTFFPPIDWQAWQVIERARHTKDAQNVHDYTFIEAVRL